MEYQSTIDIYRSQVRFYRALCFVFIAMVGVQAVLASLKRGPYIVKDSDSFFTVVQSEPWKLTTIRIEDFLKLYLSGRMEWSKDDFEFKRKLIDGLSSRAVQAKLKDSMAAFEAMARNQDMRCFYVLEGYRFSNENKVIEANVSRIIRIGVTGVVTPIRVVIGYDEAPVSEENPYGLKVVSIEETEIKVNADAKADRGSASS
jgi:type IV secretory pathway component VirB8